MTDFEWHAPPRKSERALGLKRLPKVECPQCGERELVLFRRSVTDWSETHLLERLNPFAPTPKNRRLRWTCRDCSFIDEYDVPHDPLERNGIEQYDPDAYGREQTTLEQWNDGL